VVVINLQVDFYTPTNKLEQLYAAVQRYVQAHPVYWQPSLDWYAEALQQTVTMDISFWLNSTLEWSEVSQLFQAKSDLLHELRLQMDRLGISWAPAKQTYLLERAA